MEKLLHNLKTRGFVPYFVKNAKDANTIIGGIIKSGETVGFGGSMTVHEIGIVPYLNAFGVKTLHREFNPDIPRDEMYALQHTADWYITSTNAITESGDFVNVDGRGNRVADMVHGPKNVIIVTGVNKIVKTLDDAVERIKTIAAPKNTLRLNRKTPCAITGKCENCNSPDNICRTTVILHRPTIGHNVFVVLIDQSFGY